MYGALGVPFAPATVGSLRAAGGVGDPDRVVRAPETALLDGRDRTVKRVGPERYG